MSILKRNKIYLLEKLFYELTRLANKFGKFIIRNTQRTIKIWCELKIKLATKNHIIIL